jgi:hypothetical protein
VLNTYGSHGGLEELIGDQIQIRPVPDSELNFERADNPHVLHQATMSLLAQRWKEIKANTFWTLDSDCMTGPTCNKHHDFIRTPFGTFFIWLER